MLFLIVRSDVAKLLSNWYAAKGCNHGLIEPVHDRHAESGGAQQPVPEKTGVAVVEMGLKYVLELNQNNLRELIVSG
jgi:hypothetical protein